MEIRENLIWRMEIRENLIWRMEIRQNLIWRMEIRQNLNWRMEIRLGEWKFDKNLIWETDISILISIFHGEMEMNFFWRYFHFP